MVATWQQNLHNMISNNKNLHTYIMVSSYCAMTLVSRVLTYVYTSIRIVMHVNINTEITYNIIEKCNYLHILIVSDVLKTYVSIWYKNF